MDARSEFRVEYRSHVYEFSSSEAKQKFAAAPERYTASASGLDVVAINQGTTIALGSLEHALWFRHKLYLFLNEQNKEQFRSQCRQLAVEN